MPESNVTQVHPGNPDRPFRIVIHDGFYHAKLGVYSWQELNLQVRYTLRHETGEINIALPRE
jgi:hypothetical protein